MRLREGPVQLAARTGVAASTVHRILRAAHLNRLSYTDRATGQVVRRYEHPYPGSLVHVDVKKIGNIPDGGGWRYVGARQGARNRASTPGKARSQASRRPVMGYACVHSVIDDYSRVVYSEIHDDEKADTAVGVLQRAVSWFSARGVKVERVLSDNGSAYRSQAWQAACQQLGIKAKHTRPYRPQTNGKIERFHRTLADGWAYARHYTSETQRRQALPAWLHLYNHHRPHTATQGHPPITRLTNLPDQYNSTTFACPDLTTFLGLDALGLTAVGQHLTAKRAVIECRMPIGFEDPFCRACGAQGVSRGTVARRLAHVPVGWRPTQLVVRVRRFACTHCRRVRRQDTSGLAQPRARLTRSAVKWGLRALALEAMSVSRVAAALGELLAHRQQRNTDKRSGHAVRRSPPLRRRGGPRGR